MGDILELLEGGDLRSIGRVSEVVDIVSAEHALFGRLFDGMLSDDPVIRMRSADAAEKITAKCPEYLQPYKTLLIEEISSIEQQEIRWHVAQMMPRLKLTESERTAVIKILVKYTDDKSRIVKTFAMQALADMAAKDKSLRPRVIGLLEELVELGSPAMKNRGEKLLERLYNEHE